MKTFYASRRVNKVQSTTLDDRRDELKLERANNYSRKSSKIRVSTKKNPKRVYKAPKHDSLDESEP